jgi:hypothetical protein
LERLELAGALVTIDVIGCQDAIAGSTLAKGGDCLLALKGNRPATFAEVALFFREPPAALIETATSTDADHGRIEVRRPTSATTCPGSPRTAVTPPRSPFPASPWST